MYFFISYASANYNVAEDICNLIEKTGRQCFLAPRDIRTGYEYAEEIMGGIERSDAMLLLLSKDSNTSPHVLREVERAVSKKIPIIVYKLEEVTLTKSMEYFLMSHQWISAKPGVGHSEILKCVEEFDGEPDTEKKQAATQIVKAAHGNSYKYLFIFMILLILVLAGMMLFSRLGAKDSGEETLGTGESLQNAEEQLQEEPPENVLPHVEPGDTIVFGNYNGEAIEWRVLKLSEDGGTAVVVSKDILTMKAFDAAESGSYNYYNGEDYWGADIRSEEASLQHLLRGNNDWALSNIRTWLNSSAENVVYEDQKPATVAMSELKNGYDMEPGFLSNFSEEERAAIVETKVETNGSVTQDKVFLLSVEELAWFKEADVNVTAIPTVAALEQDSSNWYEVHFSAYGVEDYCWWLRDGAEGSEGGSYEAYVVSGSYTGGETILESVGLEGFGIRPAMTIDLSAECIEVK